MKTAISVRTAIAAVRATLPTIEESHQKFLEGGARGLDEMCESFLFGSKECSHEDEEHSSSTEEKKSSNLNIFHDIRRNMFTRLGVVAMGQYLCVTGLDQGEGQLDQGRSAQHGNISRDNNGNGKGESKGNMDNDSDTNDENENENDSDTDWRDAKRKVKKYSENAENARNKNTHQTSLDKNAHLDSRPYLGKYCEKIFSVRDENVFHRFLSPDVLNVLKVSFLSKLFYSSAVLSPEVRTVRSCCELCSILTDSKSLSTTIAPSLSLSLPLQLYLLTQSHNFLSPPPPLNLTTLPLTLTSSTSLLPSSH